MTGSIQTIMDYFIYSEGNIKGLIICCLISLSSFILLILTFVFGKSKPKPEKVKKNGGTCSKCGKKVRSGISFCEYCGNKM